LNKVLLNKNIILTRTKDQSVQSVRELEKLGANVISFPTIKISPISNNSVLDETLRNINWFNTIIFTSENAVKYFFLKIEELKIKFDPNSFFVISIGDKTSVFLKSRDTRIDFQPKQFTSEHLIKELSTMEFVGRKVIIPSSDLSNPEQFKTLENLGAEVTSIPVYTNTVNEIENLKDKIKLLQRVNVDLFIFTSPSTYNGFIEILRINNPSSYFKSKNIAVIGPVTKSALIKTGIVPNIVPPNFTMNFLIEEIVNFYNEEKLLLN
jgi:uroporphyrinogen-III synthase